jgi:hypothetical protein
MRAPRAVPIGTPIFFLQNEEPQLQKARGAQGIEAEILLAQPKDCSGKPGFLRLCRKKCARMITVFILEPAQML